MRIFADVNELSLRPAAAANLAAHLPRPLSAFARRPNREEARAFFEGFDVITVG